MKESNLFTEQFHKDIEEITRQEISKVKEGNLLPLAKLQNQTDKMIDSISSRFYRACKKKLYANLEIFDPSNEIVGEKEYLNNLFKFVEASYHKPYYHLLFLRNNLGFEGDNNFFVKEEIATPWETKVFIEIRTEIVQKIVNCFTYCEP